MGRLRVEWWCRKVVLSWSMARLILAVIALFLTCLCCGDGFYAAKEGEGVPRSVFERAIVSLHNGVETVIVQSQIDAPAGSYAWIVPVPTPPTKVFEGNNLVVDPTFRHFSPGHLYYATVLAGISWVLDMRRLSYQIFGLGLGACIVSMGCYGSSSIPGLRD